MSGDLESFAGRSTLECLGRFAATGDVTVLAKFTGKRVGGIELVSAPG